MSIKQMTVFECDVCGAVVENETMITNSLPIEWATLVLKTNVTNYNYILCVDCHNNLDKLLSKEGDQ